MKAPPLFTEAHRLFFLAAGIFAFCAVAAWELWLGVHAAGGMVARASFAVAPHQWHAHELIFGYVVAVIAGFFFTAVPNWTKAAPPRAPLLIAVAVLWVAGRLAISTSAWLPAGVVAAVDLAVLPVLAAWVLGALRRNPKPANLMLVLLLALVWAGDVLTHLDWLWGVGVGADVGLRTALLGQAAMVAVIGGRVTPAFTRNAMRRSDHAGREPSSPSFLTALTVGAALILPLLSLLDATGPIFGTLAGVAAAGQALRLSLWQGWWTRRQPILWSLHLASAMLAAGYAILALAAFGYGSEIAALHVIGIGGVGGMTLAVMSRAALGHSGRPLIAPRPLAAAYAMLALAAVARAAGSLGGVGWYWTGVLGAGALWCLAFAIFIVVYVPILAGPPLEPAS